MQEGFRYILASDVMRSLMLLGLAPMVLGMPYMSLAPVFARDVLHVGPVGQGLLLTSAGLGALVGALSIASLGSFRHKGMLMLGGATMFGLALVAFSRSTVMPLSMAFLFVAGLSSTSYTSQNQTIIQTLVPRNLRGRVLGVLSLERGLVPVGSLLAGTLATLYGGPWAVTLMGAACAIVAVSVAIRSPQIRRMSI
jgi:MFS family permease